MSDQYTLRRVGTRPHRLTAKRGADPVGIHAHPTWFVIVLIFLVQATTANYQAGLNAYNTANYKTAMQEWKATIATPPGAIPPATYAEANYAIGMLYWMGQGVPVDYKQAATWLQKAANLGHAGAQGKLGYLYTEGIAVPQSYETAFKWFSKAAKQGDIDGQYNLGIFYLNGWGTTQNKTMAAQYLAAASAQGDKAAEAALQNLLPQLGTSAPPRHPRKSGDLLQPTEASTKAENGPRVETPRHPRESGDLLQPNDPPIHPSTWILNQNPNNYTIQVIGLRSKQALEDLISNHKHLTPFAIYTVQLKNQPLYVLIQGNYPTVELAREATQNFPKVIQNPKNVWIRRFKKVQEQIK